MVRDRQDHNLHNKCDRDEGPGKVSRTQVMENLKQEKLHYTKSRGNSENRSPLYKGEDHEMTGVFEDLCENCLYQSRMISNYKSSS